MQRVKFYYTKVRVLNKGVGESVMHKAARLGYTVSVCYVEESLKYAY